jgi:hypothetical protein
MMQSEAVQSEAVIEARDVCEALVRTILEPYDLLRAYAHVCAENPSNELPYHNLHHTNCLVMNCAEGAVDASLPKESRRALLLAAVFHDFAHSGGKEKDAINIRAALEGLRAYHATDATVGGCLGEVTRIIESTEFPPVAAPVTPSERIIRDADMMQIYMPGWREHVMVGLRKEIEVATGKPMSLAEMVRVQVRFMESVSWHTSWARKKADARWASLIDEVRRLEAMD